MQGNERNGNKLIINENDKTSPDFSTIMELTPQERAELLKMWRQHKPNQSRE